MRFFQPWSDQEMDDIIGAILRVGVITSAMVVLMGGIIYLYYFGSSLPDYRAFHGEPLGLRNLQGIFGSVLAFQPGGIIQFGIILLIATPIIRVAFAILAFALQRDRVYVLVTIIVLLVLLYSLVGVGR